MPVCAFCDRDVPRLTKEHLWPAALHTRISEANALPGDRYQFYLKKIDKTIAGEPQIKDVCATCNNGPLSMLDGYVCQLWDECFHRIVPAGAQIAFRYDYHLLVRWLLKICFNAARMHDSDVRHLRACREYILKGDRHPDHVVAHVQLTVPSPMSADALAFAREHGIMEEEFEPRLNRVGHLGYRTRFGYGRIVRAVHLQSFVFLIHLYPENVEEARRRAELRDFAQRFPYAKRLKVSSGTKGTTLICRGLDALESYTSHLETKERWGRAKQGPPQRG